MSRARFQEPDDWQTAVASENGSGCLSFYILPPLAVFLIAGLLAILAFNSPVPTAALPVNNSTLLLQPAAPPINNLTSPIQSSPLVTENSEATTPLFQFSSENSTSSAVISPIFTREVQHWANDIARWAGAASLDPNLAAVVMQIESCGDPRATSRSGAMGLFQVMPFHFHTGENPYDPDTNALRGMNYLARSLNTANGNPYFALAGYNGGIGVIARGQWSWAAETLRYVRYGAPIYEDARSGATSSAMSTEWYQKYGAGLCRQAAQRLGLP